VPMEDGKNRAAGTTGIAGFGAESTGTLIPAATIRAGGEEVTGAAPTSPSGRSGA
jgi:hypothetical protein